MKSSDFKTRTSMKEENNPIVPGIWSIAVDIGYSSVKCMTVNKVFSFPSFVKESDEEDYDIFNPGSTMIRFRNKHGKIYDVGVIALNLANIREVNYNISTMYGRDWYDTETYQICLESSLGLAILSNKKRTYNNEALRVITGLPCKYYNDADILKSMITGHHSFDMISPNSKDWEHFEFNVADTIVIPQPLGALWSAGYDNFGKETADSDTVLKNNVVVFDGGFGTLDFFGRIDGVTSVHSTYRECGMKEVFLRTVKEIKDRYNEEIPIPMLYRFLDEGIIHYDEPRNENGIINYSDPDTYIRKTADFSGILMKNSRIIAETSLQYLLRDTKQLSLYRAVILSGGSAAAWSEYLSKAVSALGVSVINANRNNTSLDPIFNNVRGYYMSLINLLRKERSVKHENKV